MMENSDENIDRVVSEEQTKTADDGVSQMKLDQKVVHVFHESKDSEGDEVFEEAMMDANPDVINPFEHRKNPDVDKATVNGDQSKEKLGGFDSLDANGSPNDVHEAEKFKDPIEIDLSSEDQKREVEQMIVVEEKSLVAAVPIDEVRIADTVLKENKVSLVVDDDDNLKEVQEEESNKGVVGNVEGDVKEISAVTVDGETKPLTNGKEGSNGSCDVLALVKSENGDKLKLEVEPTHVESPDVEKVGLDEIGLSHGIECSERISCQDERSREMKDTVIYVDTSLDEDTGTSEIKVVSTNLGASVGEGIETLEIKNPPVEFSAAEIDERVKHDEVELEAIDGQNSQVQHIDQNIGSVENIVSIPRLEEETNTADSSVSQLKLAEKVVHVFHESKDSEAEEIFEEVMMDANPEDVHPHEHQQKPDAEEAIVNVDQNLKNIGDFDSLEVNGRPSNGHEADKFKETFEIDLPSEDKNHELEQSIVVEENGEAVVAAKPDDEVSFAKALINENKEAVVVNEDNIVKEALLEESNNGVVGNEEGDAKEISTVNADEETKHLTGDEGSNGSCDVIVCLKSENGDKLNLEEKPVCSKSLDISKVDSDEIGLSHGNESTEQIRYRDDHSREMKDAVVNVDTSLDETPDIKKFTTNPGSSEMDMRVKTDAAELVAKDDQNSQVQHTGENIEEGSDDHPVIEEPEKLETPDVQEKQDPVSNKESGASILATEPEIQPTVDPSQSPPRPAGLGSAAPLLEPASRALQQPRVNGAIPQRQAQLVEDPTNGESEENDETREKLQMIRVKFLRLAHRLGQTPHNVVVAQVLYRLGLAEQLRGRNTGRVGTFSFDRASAMAEQLEAAGQEPLDFSCTIMVLGKTGVGKSATINSIFDEVKFSTDAFQMGTKKVQDVVGTVQGIKVRVIDTPGLLPCWSDQCQNEKILHSIKRFIKKTPPDIVLYLDRLDMQSRDSGDMPLLRTITEIFGPSIWFNAIVVLTHAASAPPDGPNGIASSYEMFVTQRSHVVQQAIRQSAGDMRLMNPVSLVENHSACRTNRAGQRVLPNGQVWKPHLLLLSFASKILAEANTLLKLQDSPPGKPFATRPRVPPLPLLLSSLLQSRPQLKMPEEQLGDEDDLDEDLDDSSDSDDDSDYDELPPFKRLMKAQLAKLNKAQKKDYFDELEYREKLFMKKQLKEEKKRRKLLKKMGASAKDLPNDYNESVEEESGGAASVPVTMPDFSLPTSFDSDNPTHRYRFLDSSSQWLVRPVLETHGWDHDVGYEGINVERLFVIKDKIPASFSGQVTKDKKEANLQMELASSIKHGEGKATSVGLDMQTVGKDMAYTLRGETRFSNFRHNKTSAGLSFTLLGDALTAGVKLEDRLIVNKRFRLVLTGGAMTSRGDVAYGGSLEATLRDKDYPLGRTLSTFGLSIMDWHGDLAIGCNLQSQIPIGRTTNVIARANLNNRGAGQVSIRLNSSEQLQIALIGLLPLFRKMLGHYQQMLYGE